MPGVASTGSISSAVPVAFTGRNGAFRNLVMRGAFIELITFGFYRFWLTTDIRRHLWSRTEIDGDALEYIGRGKELLLGFLIAMTVLAPLFAAYFVIGLEFERFKAFASLPLYLLIIAFGQFAAYRARRYRLTRTVWRGLRFWMTGSGWAYAWRSMSWGLLLVPTLGFVYPWRSAALERYKLRNTHYGTLSARFEATGTELFKRVWWIWLLGLLPFLILVGTFVAILPRPPVSGPIKPPAWAAMVLAVGFMLFLSLPFLHGLRRASEWRWWFGGIRFGDVSITCNLRPMSLIAIYWKLVGLILLVVLGFGILAGGLAAVLQHSYGGSFAGLMKGQMPLWGFALYAFTYLFLLVTVGMVFRIYSLQRIWSRVVAACTVMNIGALSNVVAAGDSVSAIGEGLADGLDFGL